MTANEVKNLLKIYYDIPQMIAEEFATIRNCESEMNKIALPSINLSGMPSGKGVFEDHTANMAMISPRQYYTDEIKRCSQQIVELRKKRDWIRTTLDTLDRNDRKIIQLAYMGPSDPAQRRGWRAPTWKVIAQKTNYSESMTQKKGCLSIKKISKLCNEKNII